MADIPSIFMTPAAYSNVKEEKKTEKPRSGSKIHFSGLFEDIKNKDEGGLGPLVNFPVSEETLNKLKDEVHSTGDTLKNRPFNPENILRYKKAVRNFMHYVVENCYDVEFEAGIPNYLKPSYKGPRGTPEARYQKRHTKIQVIDKKLEDLAADLLSRQMQQLELVARLEEIKGLLIDLLE